MAITFQAESFEQTLPEFSYLLPQHWEELALQKDKVPLSPQFDIYFEREFLSQRVMRAKLLVIS